MILVDCEAIMVPQAYNMVSLDDLDLAEANGDVVEGIYSKILEAIDACGILMIANWKFAGIHIAPSYCTILQFNGYITLNGLIRITENDRVYIDGVYPAPVISELIAEANATYEAPSGVDGYNPVVVRVSPVIESVEFTENGIYQIPEGIDGYGPVEVNVESPSINPYIVPDYWGLSYGYQSTSSNYYANNSNTAVIGYYHLMPGAYCFFAGEPVSSRLRGQFYSGKNFSDFEEYVLNSHPNAIVFPSTTNITGSTDLTGNDLKRRFFFTTQDEGELLVTTSNTSDLVKSFVFKITN